MGTQHQTFVFLSSFCS